MQEQLATERKYRQDHQGQPSMTLPEPLATRYSNTLILFGYAICVASDDPRLKEK